MADGELDYYAILGISVDADVAEVRRAWRRLALEWHPDRAGPEATATFQRMRAAYEVLCDPRARAAYDRRRGVRRSPPPEPAAEPVRRRAPGVMLQRLSGPLQGLLARGIARYAEDDVIELLLDAEEAREGGMVTISMRVLVQGAGGVADELFSAWLAVPPGVADGAVLTPSATPGGMQPVWFRVRLEAAA